jgi:hypothetical protein
MKLLKSLFVLFVVVSLVSCSSDDSIDPLLDTDGDGVVDIDDLCPNIPGTIIDQGCYLLTNINLSTGPTYSTTLRNTSETQTTNVNGLEIISEITKVGGIFQLGTIFSEDGTFVINGEYLETYVITVSGIVTAEDVEIITFDNVEGIYSVNNNLMTINLDGETYSVTLFNESELIMTSESIYTLDDIDYVIIKDIRMIR